MRRPAAALFAGSIAFLLPIAAASLELPTARLHSVFPPGARVGATVELAIGGEDLDGASELLFTHAGITAAPRTGAAGPFDETPPIVPGRFVVTVSNDVPAGVYEVRAVGRYGVSNPRVFVVGDLPELDESEGNNELAAADEVALGSTVNGRVDGNTDVDTFRFRAAKGQRVVVDCQAARIDSRLDAMLTLFAADGTELRSNRGANRQDPLLVFTATDDGELFIALRDTTYLGGGEYVYRLTISAGPYVAFARPPAGVPGTRSRHRLYGWNLPGGAAAPGMAIDGESLEAVDVDIQFPWDPVATRLISGSLVEPQEASLDGMEYRLRAGEVASNPIFLGFSREPVVLEADSNDDSTGAQRVVAPCEVAGSFWPERDRDWIAFEARKGDVFWIEVFSQRLRAPTDPFVVVYRSTTDGSGAESLREIKQLDDAGGDVGGPYFDTGTDDARWRFDVPEDGLYKVLLYDLYAASQGDPRHQYRLSIRHEQPDFRLVALPLGVDEDPKKSVPVVWNPFPRRGEVFPLRVMAFRRDGFDGEIGVTLEGLPEGVRAADVVLGKGESAATMLVEVAADAAEWRGPLTLVGRARIGEWEVTREARAAAVVWPTDRNVAARAKLVGGLAAGVCGRESVPLRLAFEDATRDVKRGETLEIPVAIERNAALKGKANVSGYGEPAKVELKKLTIDENASEAKLAIEVKKDAPLGEHVFCAQVVTELDYARNVEEAAAADERKTKLEALVAELDAASKKAASTRDEAARAAEAAAARVGERTKALEEAVKVAADAEQASKSAAETAESARVAVEKDAANEALIKASEEAAKSAEAALAKSKEAAAARVEIETMLEAAKAEQAAAAAAGDAARKVADESAQRLKEASEARDRAAKRAEEAANAAKPKKIKAAFLTGAIRIRVTE